MGHVEDSLVLILFAGLDVRLLYITSESVWWDEFATVAFLKARNPI